MLRTIIKTLWFRKRRLAGTGVAVVLGVAFLAATLILGATTKAGFRDTGELVGSPRAGIDDPIYARYVWERT